MVQAALAYKLYQKKFSGPRWEALVTKGAKKQRLLWASTSVKNPAYPDTLYVDPLIGPDTVSFRILFYSVIILLKFSPLHTTEKDVFYQESGPFFFFFYFF